MTKKNLTILFLLLLIFGIYWRFFLPGPRVATDFPLVSDNQLKSMIDFPRIWSEGGAEGLGEYSAFFLWAWPLSFISGVLANLGVTFQFLEKFFLLMPILTIGVYGILKLTKNLNLSSSTRFICALFYLTNTYILLLVDGGQLSIGLTYAFFPLSFLAVERSLTGRIREKMLAGITISILGFLDIRFVYILFLLCLIRFFYQFLFLDKQNKKEWIFEWLKTGLVGGGIVLGLHFYWLFPILKDPSSKIAYSLFTQLSSSNLNLGHPLLLISPNWYKNIFGVISPLRWEFILIPILVFFAPVLRPKSPSLGFWLLVALISTFLAKGDAQPFSSFFHWLFNKIPYFSIFRDSTKFFTLVALSYTVLLGFTLEEIKQKIKVQRIKRLFFLFIVLYLLFLASPVWLGWTTGTFSQSYYKKEYQELESVLQQDTNFSRVFWIPSFPPLGYLSQNHPRVEATRLVQKRPFAVGTVGSYEYINFLREAPYMGEIFDVAGIGYIAYPYLDPRRDNMHPDNVEYYYTFSDQLSKSPWLTKVEGSAIPLFKVKNRQDRFFVTPNTWWIIGSDNIYNESTKSANLKLSKNALIFAEEYPNLVNRIDELPLAKIVLNNKTSIDLAASFIKSESLIFPAKQLGFDPDVTSGWWKRETADLINWRDFLQTKYGIDNQDFDLGGGWAVAEKSLKLKVQSENLKKKQVLLARVLESTKSGELNFSQDGQKVGSINTKKEGNNIRWFEVGDLQKDGEELEIFSSGDINVVSALAILDKNEWLNDQDKADKLQLRVVPFDKENAENSNSPKVTYQKINPTKYIVNVSNLAQSASLVFSQNYDNLWRLNGQIALPVYSLLNGFKIDHDGEYIIEYEAQKFVNPGLIISGITLAILLIFLLRLPPLGDSR